MSAQPRGRSSLPQEYSRSPRGTDGRQTVPRAAFRISIHLFAICSKRPHTCMHTHPRVHKPMPHKRQTTLNAGTNKTANNKTGKKPPRKPATPDTRSKTGGPTTAPPRPPAAGQQSRKRQKARTPKRLSPADAQRLAARESRPGCSLTKTQTMQAGEAVHGEKEAEEDER